MKKRLLLSTAMIFGFLLCTFAKRINPNLVVDGTYRVTSNNSGIKAITVTQSNSLKVNRGDSKLEFSCGDYRYRSTAVFSTDQRVQQSGIKTTKAKAKKASSANTASLRIIALLKRVNRFEKRGAELRLYESKKLLLTLETIEKVAKQEDAQPSSGLTLKEDAIAHETTGQSVFRYRIISQWEEGAMMDRIGVKSRISFDDKTKRITATTGCNNIGGSYDARGTALTISALMSTKMACDGDAGDAEKYLIKNLEAAKLWRQEGNHMYIEDKDGQMIIMLESTL
jgi:heat shock protein HslJ